MTVRTYEDLVRTKIRESFRDVGKDNRSSYKFLWPSKVEMRLMDKHTLLRVRNFYVTSISRRD